MEAVAFPLHPAGLQDATGNISAYSLPHPQDTHSDCDYNIGLGKERFPVYLQTLPTRLREATQKQARTFRVHNVRQSPEQDLATYLERPLEIFSSYTRYDPETGKTETTVIFVFVNRAAPDVEKKLQTIE